MTRTVQVDLGHGLETVEISDELHAQLEAAAVIARMRAAKAAYARFAASFSTFSSTFDRSGFFGSAGAYKRHNGWGLGDPVDFTAPEPTKTAPEPARPAIPRTTAEALAVLDHYAPGVTGPGPVTTLRRQLRRAKRATHPDTGGTAPDFQVVTAAEAVLRTANRI